MAWAERHRRELNAQRIGYADYVRHEPILPLPRGLLAGRGENLTHAFDLVSAALTLGIGPPNQQDERALSSNAWLRGVTILLSSMIAGILDSTAFFKQSTFPLEPCDDRFHVDEAFPVPETQLGLIKELVAQLTSELTATGNRVMDEEAKWTHIRQMEVLEYKHQIHSELDQELEEWKQDLLTSMVGREVDEALRMLLARLEVDGDRLKDQVVRARQALTNVEELKVQWKAEYDASAAAAEREDFLDSVRSDYRRAAANEAEIEWRQWKDTELAKAKTEALRSLSLDYVLEKCGDDARALIAEKREFAKGYVAAHYQTWVGQALEERWPSVEAEAQTWTRERYLNLELARIWPEVGAEARALTEERATKYKEGLWKTAQRNADADHREEQAIAALKQKKKSPKSKTGKQAVEAARGRSPAPLSGSKRNAEGVARPASVAPAAPAAFTPVEMDMPMSLEEVAPAPATGSVTAAVAAAALDMDPAYDPGYTSSVEDLYLGPPVTPVTSGAQHVDVRGADRPEMVAPLQINEEVAKARGAASSMHNPANAMEDDPSTPRGQDRAVEEPMSQESRIISAVRELLAPLAARVEHLADTVRAVDLHTRPGPHPLPARPADLPAAREESLVPSPEVPRVDSPPAPESALAAPSDTPSPESAEQRKEGSSPTDPLPSPPRRTRNRGRGRGQSSKPPPPMQLGAAPPAPQTPAPSVPPGAPAKSGVGAGSRTAAANDGFISVGRRGPSYSVVTAKAISQQAKSNPLVKAHAGAQGRTPGGKLKSTHPPASRSVTRVVVVRYGGLEDETAEKALRATNPGHIVQQVRTAIERQTSNPIRLLSGAWSKEVAKTGNFVYTITGKVPMERVLSFSKYLCQPFPGSTIIPTEGWCWAQLRDVLVASPEGVLYDEDDLCDELTRNPAFQNATFVHRPHWMTDVNAPSAPPPAPRSILKHPTEPEMPSPPARVDDGPADISPPADVNLFDDEALAALASVPSRPPSPPAPVAPTRPRACMVTRATDTARANELPAERAAKRSRAYSPTSVQGPLTPAFPTTRADSRIAQTGAATASLADAPRMVKDNNGGPGAGLRPESVAERIRDMFPGPTGTLHHSTSEQVAAATARLRQMATEARTAEIIVTVGGVRYLAPFDDLCPRFHALRDEEGSYLLAVAHDEPVLGVNPGTIAAYEALALSSRAFGGHDLLGQPLTSPSFHHAPREDATNGFSTDLDDDGWAEWRRLMELHSPVVRGLLRSTAEIDTVLDRIYDAFNEACGTTMKRKGRNAARAAPWWNAECAVAAVDLADSYGARRR
ncbi:hypothetical protein H4582DRAFT_2067704 [Lactarius indigo]|nr:hypothetical protein H4582DRAFT_2067704 [Lactarius indigo]